MKVYKLVDFSDIYNHKEIWILSFDIEYVCTASNDRGTLLY